MAFYWIPTHSRPVWIRSGWQCDGNANNRCNSSSGLMVGVLLLPCYCYWGLCIDDWWRAFLLFWDQLFNVFENIQQTLLIFAISISNVLTFPACLDSYQALPILRRAQKPQVTFSWEQFQPPSLRREAMIYLGCVPLWRSTSWEHVIININL